MEQQLRDEYARLVSELNRHCILYHDKGEPEISDQEYDFLMNRLKEIELLNPNFIRSDSPSRKVGYKNSNTDGVKHIRPMLSLSNAFNDQDMDKYFDLVEASAKDIGIKPIYLMEHKMDGLALSITYVNGVIKQALTRGDGTTGEDVTEAVKHINQNSIPREISIKDKIIEVRGEVYLSYRSFSHYSAEREERGDKPLISPRNAAVGLLKRKNDFEDLIFLCFRAYDLICESETVDTSSYTAKMTTLSALGFDAITPMLFIDRGLIKDTIKLEWERRGHIGYPIDGLVVKVDSVELMEYMGYTSSSPRSSIAYKFPAEAKETKLAGVTFQVGRTGVLTPVAHLAPIELADAVISRVTLHNEDELERLNLHTHDYVTVIRSGEVIPKIVSARRTDHPVLIKESAIIRYPSTCPSCDQLLVRDPNIVAVKCVNDECRAILIESIKYFVSRNCMDIEGFGDAWITALVYMGQLKKETDLFSLTKEQLMLVEGSGERIVAKLLNAIDHRRAMTSEKLFISLAIPNASKGTAKRLFNKYSSISEIRDLSKEELMKIPDIGETVANNIVSYFKSNEEYVTELLTHVKEINVIKQMFSPKLTGKNFVITGSFGELKRDQIARNIEAHDGIVSGSVSKNTDYLLAGENAGSKLDKANKLGVKVINMDEYKAMLD